VSFKSFFLFFILVIGCNFGIKGEMWGSDKARDIARLLEKEIKQNKTNASESLLVTEFLFGIVAFMAFIETGLLSISAVAQLLITLDAYYTKSSSRELEKKGMIKKLAKLVGMGFLTFGSLFIVKVFSYTYDRCYGEGDTGTAMVYFNERV